jgi:hypothetical protein
MTEKDRILNNNNGEMPEGPYSIVRVKEISNPSLELDTFKQTMIAFLDNHNLNEEDIRWNAILPRKLVRFTEQLEEEDYHNDDIISHIPTMIYKLRDIREWEWYSSKLISNGFEVIIKNRFWGIFLPLLHHQGIPHKCLFIEKEGKEYPTRAITDVLTYKSFDPVTYELKKIK